MDYKRVEFEIRRAVLHARTLRVEALSVITKYNGFSLFCDGGFVMEGGKTLVKNNEYYNWDGYDPTTITKKQKPWNG